ncbi:MAG: hypothetical protein AAF830_04440 [Pseudomonadota bacterium]
MTEMLFDTYVAIDWSAANAPTKGKDSIWIAAEGLDGARCENIPTRKAAVDFLTAFIRKQIDGGLRVLAGFDFAFGYPEGFAERVAGQADCHSLWTLIDEQITDGDDNRSNRFAAGEALNRSFGEPLFWGKPHQQADLYPDLPSKRPDTSFPTRRHVEVAVSSAKSVFQLAYNGAVGSQTLLGIPALLKLQRETGAKVWPFETQFADNLPGGPSAVFAEIYPTLVLSRAPEGDVKDKAQVEAMAYTMARLDRQGTLRQLLEPPPGTTEAQRLVMEREEGSILGAGVLGIKENG